MSSNPTPSNGAGSSNGSSRRSSFKSKFKFKNGFKGFKKSKKNDTIKTEQVATNHNDGNNNIAPNEQSTDNEKFYYINPESKNGKKKSKKNNKKQAPPRLKLSEYKFPSTILPPSECWSKEQYTESDKQLHKYLYSKYESTITTFTFFPKDILIRFTISQRGIAPYSARLKETESHFKNYLNYHKDYHHDDVLTAPTLNSNKSLSNLQDEMNALPLFIYGQDKEGHPIFWDDGSGFAKNANLDMFKKDMDRVKLFRSRVMKRMHNVKLHSSLKYGKMIFKHCMVMDLDKFNAKKFVKDRKFHEQNTKDTSDLFPEVLHKLYIINTPWAFRSAWKVIKTFLHPITVQKTKILGKDYLNELAKDIDVSMIPYKFGGRGPWTVIYGECPLSYPIKTSDTNFDYDQLPKNNGPIPPRTPVKEVKKNNEQKDSENENENSFPDVSQTKTQTIEPEPLEVVKSAPNLMTITKQNEQKDEEEK